MKHIIKHYDSVLYTTLTNEYLENSDFANFGFWNQSTPNAKAACINLVEKLLDFIPQKRGKILDVACGKGATTRHLLKYFAPSDITAINLSEKQLITARNNAQGCNFIVSDAVALPFKNNSFNNIICVEAAFHFLTREKFFRESHRLLKPGGRLVLSDVLLTLEAEKRMGTFHEQNHLDDPDQYASLCRRAGFDHVEVLNATKPCWEGHYWDMVYFIHERYLTGNVSLEELKNFLDVTYRFVKDMRYYLLACLTKN